VLSTIKVLIMAVAKINVYKEEVGYDDRSSMMTVSTKEKWKTFTEELMFKFEHKCKPQCGKRAFIHDLSTFALHVLINPCHDVSCQPNAVLRCCYCTVT
jgi:hypothetical protein